MYKCLCYYVIREDWDRTTPFCDLGVSKQHQALYRKNPSKVSSMVLAQEASDFLLPGDGREVARLLQP